MKFHVYVNAIIEKEFRGTIVEASNGTSEGPPFVRFYLTSEKVIDCHIGKHYLLTIEEASE